MTHPQPPSSPQILTPDFWEGRYQEGTDRWDLGQPAPPFVRLLNAVDAPKPGKIAVLGAGNGHDALLFAERGFEVTGFDFAPSAIAHATQAAQARGLTAQFLQRDIFELAPEYGDRFDYVLEHTCFCAIHPSQRAAYVDLVRSLLRPQGQLIALFWVHTRPGGPPYGTTSQELLERLMPGFDVMLFEKAIDSIESRKDEEYLARLCVKK
ncbi:MAG TPA: methyltransferase domain-containing protein [Coleofasciculaceae cyanobacterium]